MTYGLDRLFREDPAPAPWPRDRYRTWRRLDAQTRLNLVESKLRPAPELGDGYPPAL